MNKLIAALATIAISVACRFEPPKPLVTLKPIKDSENFLVSGTYLSLVPAESPLGKVLKNAETAECVQSSSLPDAQIISVLTVSDLGTVRKGPNDHSLMITQAKMEVICRALYYEARRQEREQYRR